MQKSISYNFEKQKAIVLVKKAISGKFSIVKDSGDVLKVGAPMMTATIAIKDKTIEISGAGPGATIATTCASEIEMAVQEYSEGCSNQATAKGPQLNPEEYLEYQKKSISIIEQYKELLDKEIITKEEFENKKKELLDGYVPSGSVKKAPATSTTTQVAETNNSDSDSEEANAQQEVEQEDKASKGSLIFATIISLLATVTNIVVIILGLVTTFYYKVYEIDPHGHDKSIHYTLFTGVTEIPTFYLLIVCLFGALICGIFFSVLSIKRSKTKITPALSFLGFGLSVAYSIVTINCYNNIDGCYMEIFNTGMIMFGSAGAFLVLAVYSLIKMIHKKT